MNNKNKIQFKTLLLAGVVAVTTSGCNKSIVDTAKRFNVLVENRYDTYSVVGVDDYKDYDGAQFEIITYDNMSILSTYYDSYLLDVDEEIVLDSLVNSINVDNEEIYYYDELQGNELIVEPGLINRNFLDTQFIYNKALILSDDSIVIVDIKSWLDSEVDDKIQIELLTGEYIITGPDNIKLVNDKNAPEGSIENYAISLIGDQSRVIQYEHPVQNIRK